MNPPSDAVILDVPFIKQKYMYCSEAAVTMLLHYYSHTEMTQDNVNRQMGINIEWLNLSRLDNYLENCRRGSLALENLRKEINENDPVIVRTRPGAARHTLVVVGYSENSIYVHDPDRGPFLEMNQENLHNIWEKTENLSIVVD